MEPKSEPMGKPLLTGAPAVQDARALADLERKLWHAQKARDAKGLHPRFFASGTGWGCNVVI